jgi:hypothetical protein
VKVLRRSFERDFLPTLRHLRRDAYFIGLGPTPAAALSFAANKGLIDRSRILGWLAHPSKSGGSQVSVHLGERKVEELKERDPVRYRADTAPSRGRRHARPNKCGRPDPGRGQRAGRMNTRGAHASADDEKRTHGPPAP